ncbi:mannitol dehydrogenase family protein [Actibacterium pelagium]|uniref:Mannitol 2-dehydrogenase n=1 Tax=Actibacterium pelagium TaxID=2029103 RepID=A0A917AQF3_9RHOB|nr:mannitol dehydrogenase family protein [Actibacterium pelagium]GGE62695.1 mannitol 2-dehydrogenase [Actibacterium pelagium]
MGTKLNNAALDNLPEGVKGLAYDRAELRPGIIHIGLGNFHRAHQAWYLHRLFQQGQDLDWAIIGAGVRSYDEVQRLKMAPQDYLTTLIELDPSGTSAEIVGSMIDYIPVVEGHGPLIERMAQPDIRIVSMTVTEGGYYLSPSTKAFDPTHPDILQDVATPETPATAFGAILAALRLRRATGTGPFTIQSCDNLPGNGEIMRKVVVSLARLTDPEFADWVADNCSFPNSMVDCIVPATGNRELALVQEFGLDDAVPVTHENFRQWVLEDDFCAGRPAWEDVGATFTNNVHDYEAMKLRILNGGHQVIADPAEILGIETIAEAMQNPLIRGLFRKVTLEEMAPFLRAVPGMTPIEYVDLIEERFANPKIVDTVRRVAFDGSSRHTGALLPVIREAIDAGASIEGLALVQALWARMCEGTREDGSEIEPNDPVWDHLQSTALLAKDDPLKWLEMREIYGDLADNQTFSAAFERHLNMIWDHGVEAALERYLKT